MFTLIIESKMISTVRYTLLYVPLRKKEKCCQFNHSTPLVIRHTLVSKVLLEKNVHFRKGERWYLSCIWNRHRNEMGHVSPQRKSLRIDPYIEWGKSWRLGVGSQIWATRRQCREDKQLGICLQVRRRPVTGPECDLGQESDKHQKVDLSGERSTFPYWLKWLG